VELKISKLDELKNELTRSDRPDRGRIFILIRESLGLSQRAFADKIGVEAQTVSRWERNKIETPCLTLDQFQNFNNLLQKLGIGMYDLNLNIQILLELRDARMYGIHKDL